MTGGRSGGSIARSASVYVEGKHDDQDAVDNEPGGRGSGPVARALYDNLTPAVSFLPSTLLMCSARRYCLIPSTFLILVFAPPIQDESELLFKQGDVLEILEQIDDNWLLCATGGRVGQVPINYVSIVA